MKIDFIGFFERSAYGNSYIYYLVDYFSKHIYSYSTAGASTNNVILLFDHYFWANPKLYTVYIDTGSHFPSQKLHTYSQKKDIAVVFAPSVFHKSVGLIKKSNNILQQAFKKIKEHKKDWEDTLFCVAAQLNSQIIEHLGYFLVEIITRIQTLVSIERKIWINSLPIWLKVLTEEQMFFLV